MSDMRTWINMTSGPLNRELPPVGPDTVEEAKPDFLDLDKDGDKKEPMKKAAKDAEKKNEAVGDFADPIYDLIDELGDSSIVLDNLIRFLDGDTIEDFVDDFRRHHDMPKRGEAEESTETVDAEGVNESAYLDTVKKLLG